VTIVGAVAALIVTIAVLPPAVALRHFNEFRLISMAQLVAAGARVFLLLASVGMWALCTVAGTALASDSSHCAAHGHSQCQYCV
jgi:hypothetical protein